MSDQISEDCTETSPAINGPVLEGVMLIDRITRESPGRFESDSLPGHLIHIVSEGEVRQWTAGREQEFGANHLVWYHENESVRGQILEAPWTFYTINFSAPSLPPPSYSERVLRIDPSVLDRVEELFTVWTDIAAPPMVRHLRCFVLLIELLLDVLPAENRSVRSDSLTLTWWDIESELRKDLSQPIDLRYIEKLSRRSQRAISRACYRAVGMSPMKRVKEIRLSYARGLVLHSSMTMTEVAFRVGYGRVQELSRDYHQRFNTTPTDDRRTGPIYRDPQPPEFESGDA